MKDNFCKRHIYIGKKLDYKVSQSALPVECDSCANIYFAREVFKVNSVTGASVEFCAECAGNLRCSACGVKLDVDDSFAAECLNCRKVELFCPQCAARGKVFMLTDELLTEAVLNIQDIFNGFLSDSGYETVEIESGGVPFLSPGVINGKYILPGNIPRHIIIYLNILMPDMLGQAEDVDEEEDTDWWKKT